MTTEKPGLRERKKAKTRLAISNVATKMFIERGFDDVTVAEVAAAADVSVATIFNYFETKEELFFDREGEVIEAQRRFILERKAGETITSALHRGFLAAIDAGVPQLMAHGASFLRTIEGSSALRARVRLGFEKAEASLAETIAEETEAVAGDPTPQIVAAMLVAIQRTLMESARRRRTARGRRGIDEAEAPAGMRPRVRAARGGHARLREEEGAGSRRPMTA